MFSEEGIRKEYLDTNIEKSYILLQELSITKNFK